MQALLYQQFDSDFWTKEVRFHLKIFFIEEIEE